VPALKCLCEWFEMFNNVQKIGPTKVESELKRTVCESGESKSEREVLDRLRWKIRMQRRGGGTPVLSNVTGDQ